LASFRLAALATVAGLRFLVRTSTRCPRDLPGKRGCWIQDLYFVLGMTTKDRIIN
jgi:hypothetical protein